MKERGFRCEKPIVWQKAMRLMMLVYAEIKKFPVEERFALGDRLRRAALCLSLQDKGAGIFPIFDFDS